MARRKMIHGISHNNWAITFRTPRLIARIRTRFVVQFAFAGMLSVLVCAPLLRIYTEYLRNCIAVGDVERMGGHAIIQECAPRWLRRPFGAKFLQNLRIFDRVCTIELENHPWFSKEPTWEIASREFLTGQQTVVHSEDLAILEGLHCLRKLNLHYTNIDDRGLSSIAMLTNLEELGLTGTRITDGGLHCLSGLQKLEFLDLGATAISDTAAIDLSRLHNLRRLDVSYTNLTAGGLRKLAKLPNLEELIIIGLPISAEELQLLRESSPQLDLIRD